MPREGLLERGRWWPSHPRRLCSSEGGAASHLKGTLTHSVVTNVQLRKCFVRALGSPLGHLPPPRPLPSAMAHEDAVPSRSPSGVSSVTTRHSHVAMGP